MFRAVLGLGKPMLVVEEHSVFGGLATAMQELAAGDGIISTRVIGVCLPDSFLPQGSREELLSKVGLDAEGIRRAGRKTLLGKPTGEVVGQASAALRTLRGIKAELEKRAARENL